MMSKIYAGMFRKKNSEMRHMTFVKLDDVPETFLETKIKSDSKERAMPQGMELVWDLREVEMTTDEKKKLFETKA